MKIPKLTFATTPFSWQKLVGAKKILLQGNNILQELGSQLHNMNLRVQRNWRGNVINGTVLESYWTLSCVKLRLYIVDFELDFNIVKLYNFCTEITTTIDMSWGSASIAKMIPGSACLFKVQNENTRTTCSKKKTIKTLEQYQWRRSSVFIVNFEHIYLLFSCFHRLLWIRKYQLKLCKN